MAILIPDKIEFKIKTVRTDKEGHYIMMKKSVHQEDITIISMYTSNRSPKYMKQTLTELKKQRAVIIIVEDINTQFLAICRTTRQRISKKTE